VQTTAKSFQCQECDKRFSRTDLLARHVKVHKGEKPYACHECGKAFLSLAYMNKHMRCVHSGYRPVHCTHCEKGFYNKQALRIHMVTYCFLLHHPKSLSFLLYILRTFTSGNGSPRARQELNYWCMQRTTRVETAIGSNMPIRSNREFYFVSIMKRFEFEF
jgi:uncharacterized Zn-finger protein